MLTKIELCPSKFRYIRRELSGKSVKVLDIGCGNNSPTLTKYWLPGAHYSGADIQRYNNTDADIAAIDEFYPVGVDGSGYEAIPPANFDLIILNHVVEHMSAPLPIVATLCSKLKPGGYIWIAFPSARTLSFPPGESSLHFCDDDSHIYVPDVREISNILLANGVKVLRAGRSREFLRVVIGLLRYPKAVLHRLRTGRYSAGLWHLYGFEDHVLGQRKFSE